ncbi:hypothetical protein AB0M43_07545 [Longispora sp. NPDC051575]|uniref:hypothetical protein n=1 Tax=Longispora sp. NPDC051575 TaxID=3154943 RepID=UPI003433E155
MGDDEEFDGWFAELPAAARGRFLAYRDIPMPEGVMIDLSTAGLLLGPVELADPEARTYWLPRALRRHLRRTAGDPTE